MGLRKYVIYNDANKDFDGVMTQMCRGIKVTLSTSKITDPGIAALRAQNG